MAGRAHVHAQQARDGRMLHGLVETSFNRWQRVAPHLGSDWGSVENVNVQCAGSRAMASAKTPRSCQWHFVSLVLSWICILQCRWYERVFPSELIRTCFFRLSSGNGLK